jgi:hypothetical protein
MSALVQKERHDHLRALLVCGRIEKVGLSAEISSTSITPERRRVVIARYAEVVAELRRILRDLGIITGTR